MSRCHNHSPHMGLLLVLCLLSGCQPPPSPERTAPNLAYHRARNAIAQERFDWARIYLRQDLQQHPDRVESLRLEGMSWLSGYQQSLTTGSELLARYLARYPDDEPIKLQLVRTLLLIGDRDHARVWAGRLRDSAAANLIQAEVALLADPDAARVAIEQAVARLATLPPEEYHLQSRIHVLAAQIYERLEDPTRALTHALEAVRLNPLEYGVFYQLGRLWRATGQTEHIATTLETYQIVSRLQQDGTRTRLTPTEELATLRQLEPRIARDSYEFRRRKLSLLLQTDQVAEGADLLHVLRRDPRTTLADLLTYGKWADESGRRSLSEELFTQALEREPESPGALASLAYLRHQAGDFAAARAYLTRGLARDPFFARYHHVLALVAQAEGDSVLALRHAREAVLLAPWEWAWRLALADMLLQLNEKAEFRQMLAEAPEAHPRLEAYRRRYARVLGGE